MCCVTAVDKTLIGKYRSAKSVLHCRLSQGEARQGKARQGKARQGDASKAGLDVGGGARELSDM
jgi:hypothetical protein